MTVTINGKRRQSQDTSGGVKKQMQFYYLHGIIFP